jgi:Neuraminidase (sialidase)
LSQTGDTGALLPGAPIEIIDQVLVAGSPPARGRYDGSSRRLANGDLMVCYYESATSENRVDGATTIKRSRDNGRTWDHSVALHVEPGWISSPVNGLKLLPDGTLLMIFGKFQRRLNPDTRYGLEMFNTHTYITRSTDNGYSWGELEPVPKFWPYWNEFYGTNDPFVLDDGRLLFCIQGTREDNGHGWEAAVTTTSDGGRTFSQPVIIASSPDIDFNDTSLTRLDDGRILALIRSEQAPYHAYRSYSADDGATWTEPEPAGFHGSTPCLYRLNDGTLINFYRDREPDRPGLSCVISRDDGQTWTFVGQIYQSPDWFCGKPSIIRLPDDSLFLTYYTAIENGNSNIMGAYLRDLT